MPDPNVHAKRVRSRLKADLSRTPKVRKDPKFTGTQKYGREFMNKMQHNGMTNHKIGMSLFRAKFDGNGLLVKGGSLSKRNYPSIRERYKGGMDTFY
tara:strand:+ start:1585 stop:1875 length:291 start_codon:yes stop_codon:yes gene_type:complete